jgi:hypothetical protein
MNHDRPSSRQPPADRGKVLATFPRTGYQDKPDTELRLTLNEYQGRPYLELKGWARGEGGAFWPMPGRSVTVDSPRLRDSPRPS